MVKATLKDAVYGAAIGDALGVPFEFLERGTFECTGMEAFGTHDQPAGTFSDDTSMMLATCASLKATAGRIDCTDMRERFEAWLYRGEYTPDGTVFDCGITVSDALRQGRGCNGERSNGNGSLMRIAPLAFASATDDEIREVSAITHAHAISKEACVAYVRVLRALIDGSCIADAVKQSDYLDYSFDSDKPIEQVRSGGFVRDTFDAALWCLSHTENYADCVLLAVNLGNDTDTTACVAGALAGSFYGIDAIPDAWMGALRGKDLIERCLF